MTTKTTFRYAVFSGSENFEYGPKSPSVLCESQNQARHMAKFWETGYWEELPVPIQTDEKGYLIQ